MTQYIIVAIILLATVLLAVRWLVRTLRGKGRCGCQGCSSCPHATHNGNCSCRHTHP